MKRPFLLAPGSKASRNRRSSRAERERGSKGIAEAERRNPGQRGLATQLPLEGAGVIPDPAVEGQGKVRADLVPFHPQLAAEVQVELVGISVAIAVEDVRTHFGAT